MFKAVIFDWDGTLADTRKVLIASFSKALSTLNCKVSDSFIERRIGIGTVETFREILCEKKVNFDDQLIQNLLEIKVQTEIELSDEVKLFDGALELLEALNGKLKIALASMNQREFIEHMLEKNNIQKYFELTLTANEVSKPKPDPEIFLKCALLLKVKPEDCVVVEDSIFGVKAAVNAKMGCAVVVQGAYTAQELKIENPGLIVDSLKEKDALIKFILQ
jgi:HAD superfamily hydrolase (TIGR01509 family)